MNTSRSKILYLLSIFRRIPTVIFLVAFIIAGSLAIYYLRSNNHEMIRLREAVYEADKNNGDVEKALANLRTYVHSHMNTNLSSGNNAIKPPIQLKYTYERLVAANNDRLYSDAQAFCEEQNRAFSGRSRVPCIEDYVASRGEQAKAVPPALYQFDFISPSFSFDRAGWSMIIAAILFVLLILNFLLSKLMKPKSDY